MDINYVLKTDEFIKKAKCVAAHRDKGYCYSKTNYVTAHKPVIITCPKHGDFLQRPNNHLSGQGCPVCAMENRKKKRLSCTKEFVEKAKKIHGDDKYVYSKSVYAGANRKVRIICPEHGEFWQTPNNHLQGKGCPECAIKKKKKETETFIKEARIVHCDKNYDYSKSIYANNRTPLIIICPLHGEFRQTPIKHLQGCGCPKCGMPRLERDTEKILKEYNIVYEAQKKFDWLVTPRNGKMSLDFYLPYYNTAIECQGIQHFKAHGIYTQEEVEGTRKRDALKNKLCKEHNIKIFYIKYNDNVSDAMLNYLKRLKLTR